ncbi:MAG: protein kinase domain-containing protein [Gemmataceae bacterium]
MNAVCPSGPKLQEFLAEVLGGDEESVIEDHIEHCDDCQKFLIELTADTVFVQRLTAANAVTNEIPDGLRRRAVKESPALGATAGHGDPTGGAKTSLVGDPPSIPGYEIHSVLGQGGLGLVYLGTHLQLRRSVALKVLREQPFPDERERLRREAGALAGLRHQNIVQIHEAGEVDGRPYLVLEYVAGGSLARQIAGRPVLPRDAATIVKTAAAAVQAAHQKGLIHRDLKPANILLEWDGPPANEGLDRCRPKLTDFGLVKDIAGDSDLTHKRDLIGTPAYMAPEQAAGRLDVGPAADIWALGAVLYELLTGRPPFQGPSALDTLVQVRFAEPVPPTRLQPRVPRDLETICLKCLHKLSNSRYLSAADLANDLGRWLEGRPILARRTSTMTRAWQWCTRNPLPATLAAMTASLLLTLAIGGPVVAMREARLRKEASDRAAQAEAERLRAGKNLELATQALDDTLHQVYANLNVRPESQLDYDRNAAATTVPYLETLITQEAVTPEQQAQRARAKRQLGRVLPVPEQVDRAKSLFAESNLEFTGLTQLFPERRDFQRELALCHFEFGRFLWDSVPPTPEAEAQLNRAIAIQRALAVANPNDAKAREEFGNSLSHLGERLARSGKRAADARPFLTEALAIRKQFRVDNPNNITFAMSESFTRLWLGRVLLAVKDLAGAIDVMREGVVVQRQVVALKPTDPETIFILAHHEQHLGYCLALAGQWDEAVPWLNVSSERYDRLAAAFPSSLKFNHASWVSHDSYSQRLCQRQDWAGAARESGAAKAAIERFSVSAPNDRKIQLDGIGVQCQLAEVLIYDGKMELASSIVENIQALARTLTIKSTDLDGWEFLAMTYVTTGERLIEENSATALKFAELANSVLARVEVQNAHMKSFDSLTERARVLRTKARKALGAEMETRLIE